ncbi:MULTISPECIES: Bug family tripartite tricarboxylate transporter substrate binding protein [Comamonas]|jgi:tripartite-type tricarboxylate transporter receptor subunit TctC|uniref:Bug family tripartite tricarboxylate transporter substrate binding protein n=1 Tax=Comamonas TaxID=283 RepID=UPI0005A9B634|nr:tripartite tricarboxylate transporter substrate binding protein [Comamonas aquatica]MDE1553913.1 tripartite tricarboxylate transporter substrate binding protein [Comamonas aquatica]MDH0200285.1 tripartite tricarboxylate transporter substrate binding protein [Comamonas aquatica]MDH0380932.1 tripartite tricarboxylate transporter substrate binding protein [Comamonas aquatica]MDH0429350.1 tripartite tricarboxylate transporter substrate binding protein [Comamonas aquatica]MDH0898806.1 tripartite
MFASRTFTRRTGLKTLAAATLAVAGMGSALAADAYPDKPLTMIVPFSAGGTTDILARIVGQALGQELGQTIIIENKPGAGGNIGAQQASRAKADGYTLFMGTVGTHAINQALYKKLPYDPVKDFAPLSRVANVPNLLVAHPSRPYKTVQEMIAYAKKHPGEVTYGSPGSGASPHVSGALFQSMTGAEMTHVPYKGSAPAISDLLGNQIAVMFDNMPSAIQHVRSGKLRPIAVTTAKRSPELPDVPTIAEAGVPGYEATSWFGLWAVAGTPAPILTKLQTALTKVLKDPAVAKKIADQGGEVVIETPAQFDAFIKSEAAKWGKVVKESGAEV